MIKKLRKFTNMTILCLTDNDEFKQGFQEHCSESKELHTASNIEEVEQLEVSFDIMVLDYSTDQSLELLKEMKLLKPMLPKIVVLKEQSQENVLNCINYGAYSILAHPVNFDDLRLSMVMALNQSKRVDKLFLNEGVYYDAYRERFYNAEGPISFTRLEFDLLKLLLDNKNKIVSYDDIQKYVWKDKKMSIFTMRNVVNKIRKKTYYKIIKNNSNKGYQIDTVQ